MNLAVIDYPIRPIPIFDLDHKTGFKRWKRGVFTYPTQHGKCYWCGTSLKGKRKSYCSDEHKWKYYNAFSWNSLREKILLRDGFRCVKCGLTQKRLEVDHIKAVSLGGDFFDPQNLQTLCKSCHAKKTGNDRKKLNKIKQTKKTGKKQSNFK